MKVTHPFHPLFEQEFEFIEVNTAWGEKRVSYLSEEGEIKTMPLSWTSLNEIDPFITASEERAILHFDEIRSLIELLKGLEKEYLSSSSEV